MIFIQQQKFIFAQCEQCVGKKENFCEKNANGKEEKTGKQYCFPPLMCYSRFCLRAYVCKYVCCAAIDPLMHGVNASFCVLWMWRSKKGVCEWVRSLFLCTQKTNWMRKAISAHSANVKVVINLCTFLKRTHHLCARESAVIAHNAPHLHL